MGSANGRLFLGGDACAATQRAKNETKLAKTWSAVNIYRQLGNPPGAKTWTRAQGPAPAGSAVFS